MSSRSRGLIAAVLITGALATLPACGSKDKNAGAPSSAQNATTAGAASGSAAPSASPNKASATAGGTAVNSGVAGQASHLPAPGSNLTLAAVGKDTSGLPTVFYGVNNTDDKTALKTYLATLKAAGYTVTPVRQDDEIITYKARKAGQSLTVASASGVFTLGTGNMLIVRVDQHGSRFTLPQSLPSGGLETRVPASKGNIQFIAAGKSSGGRGVAFYGITGSFKGYLAALKNAGYKVAPAKQDGEPIKNTYTATKSGRHLTLEESFSWITQGTVVVTP
ncbi:hypothetical protein [Streptomyces sioyaensis]|uniref:hypothetical protein n=1 Tax=Streptomyces sioyaensis TaxID=67364 RepID=UPI00378F9FAD